jgi:hypothetical protein
VFTSPVTEINRELAGRIDREVRADPGHPYAGKFIGIANGRVVAVAADVEEVCDALERAEPDNTRTYVLEAGAEGGGVEYIWGLR